ncbi:MAG TPA: caspase family protein [Thermotogota bacterium]|nr:caspase family protein [Thermotogota bacterium]HRW92978.1 caspase family protein [Thermotogota bacterium]
METTKNREFRVCFLWLLILTCPVFLGSNSHVLVIGVGEFEDPLIQSLPRVVQDARELGWTLEQLGVGSEGQGSLQVLVNPTRGEMLHALLQWSQRGEMGDSMVLYYGGHGETREQNGQGTTFWVPHDGYTSAMLRQDTFLDFQGQVVPILERNLDGKQWLLVLDACFSESLLAERPAGSPKLELDGFATLAEQFPIQVLVSTAEGQCSMEYPEGGGIFTGVLIEGLKGKANFNEDETIEIGELIEYVKQQVAHQTEESQTPVSFGDSTQGVIVPDPTFQNPPPPLRTPPATPTDPFLPPKGNCQLILVPSETSGARLENPQVILDGEEKGFLYPDGTWFKQLEPGQHRVQLTGRYLEDREYEIDFEEEFVFRIVEVDIQSAKRQIILQSEPREAVIFVNNEKGERLTPVLLELNVGEPYRIRLEKEGFQPFEADLFVSEKGLPRQETYTMVTGDSSPSALPSPPDPPVGGMGTGRVTLCATPQDASLFVNGVLVGKGTYTYEGDAGSISVEVRKEGFQSQLYEVVVEAGKEKTQNFWLVETPSEERRVIPSL